MSLGACYHDVYLGKRSFPHKKSRTFRNNITNSHFKLNQGTHRSELVTEYPNSQQTSLQHTNAPFYIKTYGWILRQ